MNPLEPHDTFHRRSGEILRIAVNVESELEYFLTTYFCGISSYKNNLFEDEILLNMGFERKIALFKKICKHEKFNQKRLKSIVNDFNFVKEIRNKIAHFGSRYEDPVDNPDKAKIILWSRKSVKYRKDSLDITDELSQEINKRYFSARKGIFEVQNYLIERQKSGVIPSSNIA